MFMSCTWEMLVAWWSLHLSHFIIEPKMCHLSSIITTQEVFDIADIALNFNLRSYDVKVCFIIRFLFYKVCCCVRVTTVYGFNENRLDKTKYGVGSRTGELVPSAVTFFRSKGESLFSFLKSSYWMVLNYANFIAIPRLKVYFSTCEEHFWETILFLKHKLVVTFLW